MRLKRTIITVAVAVGAVALAAIAVAASPGSTNFGLNTAVNGTGIPHGANVTLTSIIGNLIKQVLSFLGVVFLILMVYAGFLYMTARGDDKKIISAKGIITGAIIGLVIIAASYALTNFVLNAVGGAVTNGTPAEEEGPATSPSP